MKAVSIMESILKTLKLTVRNVLTNKTETFILTEAIDEHTPPQKLEKMMEKALRIFRRGSSPVVELVKFEFADKQPPKTRPHNSDPNKKRETRPPVQPMDRVLYITPSESRRFTSKHIAELVTELLKDAPEDQERIDEVLVQIRYTLFLRHTAQLEVRKDLLREDFEELLVSIYSRENWSEEMIAAFWELRLLFSKSNRKYFSKRLNQEVEKMNTAKGRRYFDSQGRYEDETDATTGKKISQIIRDFVRGALGLSPTDGPLVLAF